MYSMVLYYALLLVIDTLCLKPDGPVEATLHVILRQKILLSLFYLVVDTILST